MLQLRVRPSRSSRSPPRRRTASRCRRTAYLVALTALLAAWTSSPVQGQTDTAASIASSSQAAARWGQASALLSNLLVVQGGKTQGSGGGYTYTSAPNTADMFVLDLSASFNVSSPPWESVAVNAEGQSAPTVSFHTLSPLRGNSLLLFGGDGSPIVPVQTNNDSAYTAAITGSQGNRTVQYSRADASWQEPMRRIYHTAESDTEGCVWIVGGEKADGSSILLDELWTLNPTESSSLFVKSTAPPPSSLAGASSTLLSDGTLLLLGGLDTTGQLQAMDEIYTFSTVKGTWSKTAASAAADAAAQPADGSNAAVPVPRRGHVAVSLPDKRVFIQGGANADFSTVYSDAWLLDWSVSPPVWTQLNSTGGPGARYGHAAVAYGRQVVTTFGWSGNGAADNGIHVFDGTSMTTAGGGSWSGGGWSSTYSPDPDVTLDSSGQGGNTGSQSSPGSNTSPASGGSSSSSGTTGNAGDVGQGTSGGHGGNGSSTSSGSQSSSSDGDGSDDSDAFPAGNPQSTDTPTDGQSKSTDGAKVGAAVGVLIGAGLILGAGYAFYRQRSANNNWRRGDGVAGLLGRGSRDDEDGIFMLEKTSTPYSPDRPYDDDRFSGGGFFAGQGAAAAADAGGARRVPERRLDSSPWTAGNIGHAMEGSGPHFRERLALLTGLRQNAASQQPRFDMLADEEDGQNYCGVARGRNPPATHSAEDEDDDAEDDAEERAAWRGEHLLEHSYTAVGHRHGEDLSIGDIAGGNAARFRVDDEYLTSPFEEVEGRGAAPYGTGLLAGAAAALGSKRTYERLSNDASRDEDDNSSDGKSGPPHSSAPQSAQSHTDTSTRSTNTATVSSGTSQDLFSPGGFVSFSDAASASNRGGLISPFGSRSSPSPHIRRSPTWWNKFMSNNFLERSASGRLLSGPNAEVPIRDPAQPPELDAIAESPTNFGSRLDDDPFRDGAASAEQKHMMRGSTYADGLDEMGRRVAEGSEDGTPFSSYHHGRSLSSLNSNRTATSSQLECQLRNMQVVQRVQTGSSRRSGSARTGSSSDTDSVALSRGPSMLRARNLGPLEENESTPGSVIWRPEDWTHEEEKDNDEVEVVVAEVADDGRADEQRQDTPSPRPASSPRIGGGDDQGVQEGVQGETMASPAELRSRLRPSQNKATRRAQVVSETPSITPATTKRARLNPLLTSPLSPAVPKSSPTILSGSVRDRVLALEKQDAGTTLLPSSPSSKAWSASLGAASVSSLGATSTAASSWTTTSPTSEKRNPLLTLEPLVTTPQRGLDGRKGATVSPDRAKSPKLRYSHNLVPKAQLFVANPDDRRTSSGSS
ncbi:hypothetical protein ACQY0O_003482 [Thecaphora frezii]